MKKSKNCLLVFLLFFIMLLFCTACNQDPIFDTIFQEVKPRDPRIPGSPTAMVVFEREYPPGEKYPVVYAASGKLHWYAKPDVESDKPAKWWDKDKGKFKQPGGKIIGLAATDEYLYVLNKNKVLKRIARDSAPNDPWETIPIDTTDADALATVSFDSLFACNNEVFIGALSSGGSGIPCAILYVAVDKIKSIATETRYFLEGVAFDGSSYFLCTNDLNKSGGSLLKIDEASFPASVSTIANSAHPADSAKSSMPFKAIISLEDGDAGRNHSIIAIDRSGMLYSIDAVNDTFTATNKKMGTFTGALALWRDLESSEWDPHDPAKKPKPELLLAGYQGEMTLTTSTGYTHGYYEFNLQWSGDTLLLDDENSGFTEPGKRPNKTTVKYNARYLSTIGKFPIKHLFQAPKNIDDNMTLFASTVNKGLWSYRKRDNVLQWNAEE